VRFRVNQQPDQTWFQTFKGHAASSVLRATNAAFRGHDVTLELTRPKSLAELSTALDCFIECANLGLRSWGGAERNAVEPVRGGLQRFPLRPDVLGRIRIGLRCPPDTVDPRGEGEVKRSARARTEAVTCTGW